MSVNQNYSMPYPVLGLGDDYKESYFNVIPKINVKDDYLHISQGEVEIFNDTLKELYENKKITTAYKILCSSTLYSKVVIGEIKEKIKVSELANQVLIEGFLITIEDIVGFTDSDFNDDYFNYGNGVFDVDKNSIIGVAGKQEIPLVQSFYQGAKSLFRFTATSDDELQFDLNDFYIEVVYPWVEPEINYIASLPGFNKYTFIFIFIIPALNNAFAEIKKHHDKGHIEFTEYLERCKPGDILYNMHKGCINEDAYVASQKFLKRVFGATFPGDSLIKEVPKELIK
jgi:hypothetical protein